MNYRLRVLRQRHTPLVTPAIWTHWNGEERRGLVPASRPPETFILPTIAD